MPPFKICFATSELTPFVKSGGLADVSSALPACLGRLGHDARIFVPFYASIRTDDRDFTLVPRLRDVPVSMGNYFYTFTVFTSPLPGTDLPVYFIHCPALYDRPSLYTGDADEHRRFLLLTRAVLECCQRLPWSPEVFHCHDWQTALLPLFLRTTYAWDRLFHSSRTLLTIHNLGYQGTFGSQILGDIGDKGVAPQLDQGDLHHGVIGFLKTGILHADILSTVSPTYAREIQTEEYGMGLAGLLRARSGSLVGILNGVDYSDWSPDTDPHIPFPYTPETLHLKGRNRSVLLQSLGLHESPGAPVAGIVSRLAHQKGLDLLWNVIPDLMGRHDFRLAILGSGESKYEDFFSGLQHRFPGRVCFYSGYNDRLAHLIEAGSDIFLMPSRYEPCGLNQMYSLRYGTVPVVRKTGGLADTVTHYDPATGRGTGFVFEHFTAEGLTWALELALHTYRDGKAWRRIMRNAMAEDFSWDIQGREYEALYARMTGRSAGA